MVRIFARSYRRAVVKRGIGYAIDHTHTPEGQKQQGNTGQGCAGKSVSVHENERWQIFVVKRKLMVFGYLQYGKIKL